MIFFVLLLSIPFLLSQEVHAKTPKQAALSIAPLEQKKALLKAVQLPFQCIQQEIPHALGGSEAGKRASDIHAIFYGCYDWHSAVHSHWSLVRVLPQMDPNMRAQVIEKVAQNIQPQKTQKELAYFEANPGFERPYGYAWYLRFILELKTAKFPEAAVWEASLWPLTQRLEKEYSLFAETLQHASKDGTHYNTAFALKLGHDYAKGLKKKELLEKIEKKAKALYGLEKNCPLAEEPKPADFLSPCFEVADLMRRVLSAKDFPRWLRSYLPSISAQSLEPVAPKNVADYQEIHLAGRMFSLAAALQSVAKRLPEKDIRKNILVQAAKKQREAGLKIPFDTDYAGSHWVGSYVIYEASGANELMP